MKEGTRDGKYEGKEENIQAINEIIVVTVMMIIIINHNNNC